jgi:hypothetical protein
MHSEETATSGAGALHVGTATELASPRSGRLPDFFIVGHQKCGTTALYLTLSSHPEIFMPEVKEPRFFAPELRSRFRRLGPEKLPTTLEAYSSLFAAALPGQKAGEASPMYLRSETAARRIAEVRPDARIIAILREPASFLRSLHLQFVHNHIETETNFAKAITLEDKRREGKHIPPFSQLPAALLYSEWVRYVEQLRRFHAVFAREQVLVLIYEDFRADNEGTVRRVLQFLDVDDSWPLQPVETERLKGINALPLMQLRFAVWAARRRASKGGAAMKALESLLPTMPRTGAIGRLRARMVYGDPPPPDESFLLELRRRFKPEVVALGEYLERDLVTRWGYDGIA